MKKKPTSEEVKEAIIAVFGSVQAYAIKKKVKRANVYQRLMRLTPAFLRELREDGVYPDGQAKDNYLSTGSLTKYIQLLEEKNTALEKELKELKKSK